MKPATVWHSHALGGYVATRGDCAAHAWQARDGWRWHVTRSGAVERLTMPPPGVGATDSILVNVRHTLHPFRGDDLRRLLRCEAGAHTVVTLDVGGLECALYGGALASGDDARTAATAALDALEIDA